MHTYYFLFMVKCYHNLFLKQFCLMPISGLIYDLRFCSNLRNDVLFNKFFYLNDLIFSTKNKVLIYVLGFWSPPVARAGPSFQACMRRGKFQGMI